MLAELDASNQRIADYSYFPGTVDLPFAVTMGATYPATEQFHETDELGNVIGTSEGGYVSQSVSYDAWGTPIISGTTDNRLL